MPTKKPRLSARAHVLRVRDLLDGIIIEEMDGCKKLDEALRRCRAEAGLELFLFDNDDDGRRAADKVRSTDHTAMLLDEKATVSACHRDWVLEDLVAVEAIDRFYQSCPEHIPAREEISYVPEKKGRRLVIGGVDKIALVDWLSKFAKPSDLFGVIQQMVLVRQELALAPIEIVTLEHKPSSFGLRPEPWWFVQ